MILTVLLIPLWMTACSSEDAQTGPEENPTAEESQDVKDYANGTPWLAIDLDGVVTKDTPVDVKDNFALYVNKDDILSLKLPKDSGAVGPMLDVASAVDKDILKMFQGDKPESHDAKLAYDLYQMLMDWDSRNAVGVEPLKKQTEAVERLDTIDKLTAYLRDTPKAEQLGGLWIAGIGADYEDSDKNVIQVGNDRLLLMDSAEYSKLTDYGKTLKNAKIEVSDLSKGSSNVRFAVKSVTNGQKSRVKVSGKTGKVAIMKKTGKCEIRIKATSEANKNRKAATKTIIIRIR